MSQNPGSSVDGSTTITLGGTAQYLFGGNAAGAGTPANGWSVGNPNSSGDFWISDTTVASPNGVGSIRVQANGGLYETPTGRQPAGPVSIYGGTTGAAVTASKW